MVREGLPSTPWASTPMRTDALHGYLAHKKPPTPPRTPRRTLGILLQGPIRGLFHLSELLLYCSLSLAFSSRKTLSQVGKPPLSPSLPPK